MRDDLLGYVLGALDAAEQRRIEELLNRHPALRSRVESLRAELDAMRADCGDADSYEPPFNLAGRTSDWVHQQAGGIQPLESAESAAGCDPSADSRAADDQAEAAGIAESSTADDDVWNEIPLRESVFDAALASATSANSVRRVAPATNDRATRSTLRDGLSPPRSTMPRDSWKLSRIDMVVCAGVFVATVSLLFPAIANSRYQAQRLACEQNLQQLFHAIDAYSAAAPDHRLPYVPLEGREAFAGVTAVALAENELLRQPNAVICPASKLADELHGRSEPFRIPTRDELQSLPADMLPSAQREAGGSLGYSIGYTNYGAHHAVSRRSGMQVAIVADMPDVYSRDGRSSNHWGRGQNVLFLDGRIRFVCGCPADLGPDHPFRNHCGEVEAGVGPGDGVVAPSITPPIRYVSR